jgi:hypothetical protein
MLCVLEPKSLSYQLNETFLRVQRRAEAVDRQTLAQTFVDIGALFTVLSSRDHQIIYGRRGTGKTHALLYLAEQTKKSGDVPVYVDLRYIGSSGGLYADTTIPIPQRASRLLLDVLGSIHESLLTYAVDAGMNLAAVGPALDALATATTEVEVMGEIQVESKQSNASEHQDSTSSKFVFEAKPSVEFGSTTSGKDSSQFETKIAESGQAWPGNLRTCAPTQAAWKNLGRFGLGPGKQMTTDIFLNFLVGKDAASVRCL